MAFDYSKLRGRIIEKYGSQIEFANKMGTSERTLSLKLNNKMAWKQNEICKAIQLLELDVKDIQGYFFTNEVQSIEQSAVV